MDTLMSIVHFVVANGQAILSGLVAVLTGVISICLLIPGEQPEKFLQGAVEFISKFSVKK